MTWSTVHSAQADEDLIEIWTYIAADSPAAADKLLRDLAAVFERTIDHPYLGRSAKEIALDARILAHGNYLLLYRLLEADQTIELVRVLHGARDWPRLFQ